MSIKLITSLGGVIATVGGLVGTAYSLAGSGKVEGKEITSSPAKSETFTKTWNSEATDSLEVTLGCSLNADRWSSEQRDYTFNIRGAVAGNGVTELMEKNSADIRVSLELLNGTKKEAVEKFAKNKESKIFTTILYWVKEKGFNINIGDLNGSSRMVESQDFWCRSLNNQVEWLDGREVGTVIGNPEMKSSNDAMLAGTFKDVKIIAEKCEESDNGNTKTCDLSLTDKTEKKWRIKAKEKVNFTLS